MTWLIVLVAGVIGATACLITLWFFIQLDNLSGPGPPDDFIWRYGKDTWPETYAKLVKKWGEPPPSSATT